MTSPLTVTPTTALVLIDLQNDYFDGGKWPLSGTAEAAAEAANLLSAFRKASMPVIHVRHEFASDDAPFFTPGSTGAVIHETVLPLEGEPVIVKQRINAFLETGLKAVLDERQVTKLVVVGAMSHMCIDAVVRAAADDGYEVVVAHDACATRALEFNGEVVPAQQVHTAFMSALAFGYATVTDTQTLTASLSQ